MSSQISKFEYLKFAIEDAQEIIRFIDAKTAFAVSVIGAYIVGIISMIEKIVKYLDSYSILFWIMFSSFLILLVFATITTTRIIKPTNNPSENINLNGLAEPNLPFYLAGNTYSSWFFRFINCYTDKHKHDFKGYLDKLNPVTDESIIQTLTFELLKVSYIRNLKNDRFNFLLTILIISSLLFISFYIMYNVETQNAIELAEKIKKTSCCD